MPRATTLPHEALHHVRDLPPETEDDLMPALSMAGWSQYCVAKIGPSMT